MSAIAVYGTLRVGGCNHPRFADRVKADPTPQRVQGFALYTQMGLPFVLPAEDSAVTVDVLYPLDEFVQDEFDRMEGHPNWYCRTEVRLDNGQSAWLYVGQPPYFSACDWGVMRVEGGDYTTTRYWR